MVEMAHRFPLGCDYILPVASTIDRKQLTDYIAGHDEWWPAEADEVLKASHIRLVPDAREALYHARASVVASGTATVQAALMGNPSWSSIASPHSPSGWQRVWFATP
jgi:lipid-A-disaccharide synthase